MIFLGREQESQISLRSEGGWGKGADFVFIVFLGGRGRTGMGGVRGIWEQMAFLSLRLLFGDVRWELERPLSIPLEAKDR